MFFYSLIFFENNLGQIIKVWIFWTRTFSQKRNSPDFWSPDFKQTTVVSELDGVS